MNLHNQDILLFILGVLYNSEADVLVTEHFIFSYHLPKLVDFVHITVQLHQSFSFININQLAVVSVLHYSDIDSVTAVTAIAVNIFICVFFKEVIIISDCVIIVVRVKEKVVVVFRIIISVVIIIVFQIISDVVIVVIIFILFL